MAEGETTVNSDSSSSSDGSESDCSSTSSSSPGDDGLLLGHLWLVALGQLSSRRYLNERESINEGAECLQLLLHDWKSNRPETFRTFLRVTPQCFEDLVKTLRVDEVFHNNSVNPQMPVEEQVAIALYSFGHYGNAASKMKVALWAGVGYGTVHLATTRVMAACCREHFRRSALRWPTEAVKEEAKQWVEEASCPSWHDGWLMVDGTLVPLFMRPGMFGMGIHGLTASPIIH